MTGTWRYLIQYTAVQPDLSLKRIPWRNAGGKIAQWTDLKRAQDFLEATWSAEDQVLVNPRVEVIPTPKWSQLDVPERKPDSHRLFLNSEGRISIVDNSGTGPEDADDGPLLVRTEEAVEVYVYAWIGTPPHVRARVPVDVVRREEKGYADVEMPQLETLRRHLSVQVKLHPQAKELFATLERCVEMSEDFKK